tara:strand:- start:12936 stop:13196 length:261 start_codon:yes stop_codon:yes gene_type:complete
MGLTKNLYAARMFNRQYAEDLRSFGDKALQTQWVEMWAQDTYEVKKALQTSRWACEKIIEIDHLGYEIEPDAVYRRESFGKVKIGP